MDPTLKLALASRALLESLKPLKASTLLFIHQQKHLFL
jgi:hypothetical protein